MFEGFALLSLKAFLATYVFSITVDLGKTLLEVFFNFFRKPGSPPLQVLTPAECAIVIPCHNSGDCIATTLDTLPQEYRTYCVANACTDNTLEIIGQSTHPNLTVLATGSPGKIRAVILGVLAAKKQGATFFLLLDDDVEWAPGPAPITVYSREKEITALPVVPSKHNSNWIRDVQAIEYQIMCASKRAQGNLGNVIMASGAAGIYNIETFLDAMQEHDGEHIGDDLQCSYIHLCKGMKIDFNSEAVVKTHPPESIKVWWKQRAKRWEISPLYNLGWSTKIMFMTLRGKENPGWWIRGIALYRTLVIVNDILRCLSFPLVFIFSPWVLPGVWLITYCSIVLKMLAFKYFFQNESYVRFDRATFVAVLTYPLYGLMMWVSRVWAVPKGLRFNARLLWTGERKKFLASMAALEQEAQSLTENKE